MLTQALSRSLQSLLLRCAGGDAIRADALHTRLATSFVTLVVLSYLPLMLTVVLLVMLKNMINIACRMMETDLTGKIKESFAVPAE